jgi:hypothetical protein
LRRNGVKLRRTGPPRRFIITKEELQALYQQKSMRDIARQYGVGETIVWSRLKELGITLDGYDDGRKRKRPPRTREHSVKLSKAHRGRWEGDKNPNWKGGVYDDNLKVRRTGEYRQWKIAALDRAGNVCEGCGVANGTICPCCGVKTSLHVHHIERFADVVEKRFDPENSRVLCPKCHRLHDQGKSGGLQGHP